MEDKATLRRLIWDALRDAGGARFPGARGRIPNFVGAEAAARRLARSRDFRAAHTLKCNPDAPQRPVRAAALRAGKCVYMAVPRLRSDHPFILLDPDALAPGDLWHASSIKGAAELGKPVRIDAMPPIDLIVTGVVGVAGDGARLGKGGGYSDLEYAVLREHGKVTERTPIVTTAHPVQLRRAGTIPVERHDLHLDRVFLPERTVRCNRTRRRPRGVLWTALDDEKIAAIPVLASRKPG